jgi:ankyrin repeat protein
MVPEATIVQACVAGEMSLLRRWAMRGIRVTSARPISLAAAAGKLDVVRLLLRELGADVSQSFNGFAVLRVAAQAGHEHVVRCLVHEIGANVNQAGQDGYLPLTVAADAGHESAVRCLRCQH